MTACNTVTPETAPPCPMLDGMTDDNTHYHDKATNHIYVFDTTNSKTYTQAQAACAALTFTGLTGKGYLVAWNS